MQLQKRTSTLTLEKPTSSRGIEHLSLPPDSDGLAAKVNLATVRPHDKVLAQGDGAAAIGGITGTSRADSF